MENSLDNQFDQFIKGSLEDLKASYDPTSWDALEQKIDQGIGQDIDALARQAMSGLAVPYNPATWDAMEHRIDQVSAQEIDATARRAVSELSVPYNAATWQVLSERLDRIDYRRKLIALKLVEAALILLALITAVRFIQQVPDKQATPQSEQQQMAILNDGHQEESTDDAWSSEDRQGPALKSANGNLITKQTTNANRALSDKETEIVEARVNGDPKISTKGEIRFTTSAGRTGVKSTAHSKTRKVYATNFLERRSIFLGDKITDISTESILEKTDWQRITTPLANLSGKELEVKTPKSRLTRAQMKEALVGIPTLDVRTIMHEDMPISLASAAPKIRKTKSLTTRLGVYHQISTHVVTQKFSRGVVKSHTVSNGATGVMTSVQSGKLGFDFGLVYEKLLVDGESFTNEGSIFQSEIHLVQLPLNLRVIPISNRYFDIYLKGGATAHGAIYAQYEEPLATARGIRSPYNERFNAGLLNGEGNYLEQNIYYTINYGVGLEIKVFEKSSLFIEGMLRDHYKGALGWKDMNIKSRSFSMGVNRTL